MRYSVALLGLLWLTLPAVNPAWSADDPLNPAHVPAIAKLKALYPQTDLVRGGECRAVIVAPDRPGCEAVVNRLRDGLKTSTGTTCDVIKSADVVDDGWRVALERLGGRTPIAVGNVNTNRLLAWLWTEGYVVEDSIYPGKSGYVVRTVHDPFARGINVLELAGSDAEGVGLAVDAFLDRFAKPAGRELVLREPVIEVRFERRAYPFFPDPGDEVTLKRMPQFRTFEGICKMLTDAGFMDAEGRVIAHADRGMVVTRFMSALTIPATTYFRTGDGRLLPPMKELLDKNRHLLANGDRLRDMGHRASGSTALWDLMEEWPVWTDQDRLDITNALLCDAALGHERRSMHQQVLEGCTQCLDENHGTSSALCSYEAWKYFQKYYHLPEGEYWMKVAQACFTGQCSTFQVLEDASGYLIANPLNSISYALQSKDLRYLTTGIGMDQARFVALACMNNLGYPTGFGDASSLVDPSCFELLTLAAWYYRDPRLYWVLRNRLPKAAGLRLFQNDLVMDLDVAPREPTEWTGLLTMPIYRAPLQKGQGVKEPVFAGREVDDPRHFNKMVFKENWDREGQFLLLDGAGVWGDAPGPHGHKHDDINTIINFTAQGRMWLVDHTYPVRSFDRHSGVLITRDGQSLFNDRELATLLNAVETPDSAMTRSRLGDWERGIYWQKGRYFVVLDRAVAGKDGEYLVRCTFKALGRASLDGATLNLEQAGRYCRILSDGAGSLEVRAVADMAAEEWRRFYPHAEPEAQYFRQDKTRGLKAGDGLGFINVLYPYAAPERADDVSMRPVSEHSALISDRGRTLLVGLGAAPGEAEGDMYAITESTAYALGVRQICAGLVQTDAIADLGVDQTTGTLFVQCRARTTMRLAGELTVTEAGRALTLTADAGGMKVTLDAGKHLLATKGWQALGASSEPRRRMLAQAEKDSESFARASAARVSAPKSFGVTATPVDFDMPISTLLSSDLGGEARDVRVAAGRDGVRAYSREGRRLWGFDTPKPAAVLAVGDLDGDGRPEIAAGCEDENVYVLDASGRLRWTFKCKASQDSTMQQRPRPKQMWVTDLDGDGRRELVVGASWVHVLNADGSLRWERYMMMRRGRIAGDFACGAVADINGDGKQEIVAAYSTSYPLLFGYDAAGEVVFPRDADGIKGDPDGMSIGPACRIETAGLVGAPDSRQIIAGCAGRLQCIWPDQKRKEDAGYYPRVEVVDMALYRAADEAPWVIIAANGAGAIEAHGEWKARGRAITGRQIWRTSVGESLVSLRVVPQAVPGAALVVAGGARGDIFVLDPRTGAVRGCAVGKTPARDFVADGPDAILCILADGKALRIRMEP